jgi:hypothetical protein
MWIACVLQVVGRVNKGLDVLELLGDVPCGPDDSPLMRLKVFKCGPTNAEVCALRVAFLSLTWRCYGSCCLSCL